MHIGIADHLGWAVAVTADDDQRVVDRRRLELVGPDVSAAPVHYDRGQHDLDELAALVAECRASMVEATAAALDQLQAELAAPVASISLRAWPDDFPNDLATQVVAPYEARVDAIRYREVLDEQARARGWAVHRYVAKDVVPKLTAQLGERASAVLDGPRAVLGPPWTKDHRVALAAAILAGSADQEPS